MSYIVEVRHTGADWPDLMADIRSWLDRRQIKPDEFEQSIAGRGITIRVGFHNGYDAGGFASAFSGRLERITDKGTADPSPDTLADKAGEDGSISQDWTTLSEPFTEGAPPAAKTAVSLMITRQQKADLRERGYTDEQIRDMTPEDAHRVLGLID